MWKVDQVRAIVDQVKRENQSYCSNSEETHNDSSKKEELRLKTRKLRQRIEKLRQKIEKLRPKTRKLRQSLKKRTDESLHSPSKLQFSITELFLSLTVALKLQMLQCRFLFTLNVMILLHNCNHKSVYSVLNWV